MQSLNQFKLGLDMLKWSRSCKLIQTTTSCCQKGKKQERMNMSEKGFFRFENFAVIFARELLKRYSFDFAIAFDIAWNIHNSMVEMHRV